MIFDFTVCSCACSSFYHGDVMVIAVNLNVYLLTLSLRGKTEFMQCSKQFELKGCVLNFQ